MEVILKSNGTPHTFPKEVWDKMSRDQQRNYRVVNATEVQMAKNTVDNTAKAGEGKKEISKTKDVVETKPTMPDTGDKKQ